MNFVAPFTNKTYPHDARVDTGDFALSYREVGESGSRQINIGEWRQNFA